MIDGYRREGGGDGGGELAGEPLHDMQSSRP